MKPAQKLGRRAGVLSAALAGTLALAMTAAQADIVYNTLDASIDSTAETMNLTYDSVNSLPGPAGVTTLKIQVEGNEVGDHPGCNIQGGSHFIELGAQTTPTGVASVSWPGGSRFNACDDVLTVRVTPLAVGSTAVTFAITDGKTSGDWHLATTLDEAAFTVNVTEATIGTDPGTVCDADPAAPAWAAAILKANGVKAKAATNYISQVAHAMTQRAMFGGYDKNEHPEYEDAVHDFLVGLGLTLPKGAAESARPGWECAPVS